MCLDPVSYVEARVYSRLVERRVPPARAAGVARKVAQRTREKRLAAMEQLSEGTRSKLGLVQSRLDGTPAAY